MSQSLCSADCRKNMDRRDVAVTSYLQKQTRGTTCRWMPVHRCLIHIPEHSGLLLYHCLVYLDTLWPRRWAVKWECPLALLIHLAMLPLQNLVSLNKNKNLNLIDHEYFELLLLGIMPKNGKGVFPWHSLLQVLFHLHLHHGRSLSLWFPGVNTGQDYLGGLLKTT